MEKFPDMKPPSLQFDASTPGAIVPASPVAYVSAHNRQNDTHVNKSRNRRILYLLPDSHAKSSLNITEEHVKRNSQNDNFHSNKSMSSMVVLVLVDPKEVGDGGVDGMIKPVTFKDFCGCTYR